MLPSFLNLGLLALEWLPGSPQKRHILYRAKEAEVEAILRGVRVMESDC
jgi:hypothetical protein